MQELSFEQLPKAIATLSNEISQLKQLLLRKQEPETPQQEKFITIEEASEFLHLSKATLYTKVSKGEIPVMKRSKRLYFSTTDLEKYIKSGRVKTNKEIDEDAQNYINNKKG